LAWTYTTGASDGTLSLAIPADLLNGSYEVRLIFNDPNFGNLPEVFARTEPIRVGAFTTVGTDPTNRSCAVGCDDGDPCTVDQCVPGRGCESTPAEGAASVTCTCELSAPAACAGWSVPAAVGRLRARACNLFDGASASKRVRKGLTALRVEVAAVSKARKKHKLSTDCAGALKAELLDATDRAARLLAALGPRRR
jgi:hypothetical protein